jgi:hypothetical protein
MTHCMIHYELLVMKELFPQLSEVMDTVIRSVNYIKTCPLKSRLFAEMCERGNGSTVSVTPVLQ